MWLFGAAAAVARGYNRLTFDGRGQGAALWQQKMPFRPDWEKVFTPVVDYALSRKMSTRTALRSKVSVEAVIGFHVPSLLSDVSRSRSSTRASST